MTQEQSPYDNVKKDKEVRERDIKKFNKSKNNQKPITKIILNKQSVSSKEFYW